MILVITSPKACLIIVVKFYEVTISAVKNCRYHIFVIDCNRNHKACWFTVLD